MVRKSNLDIVNECDNFPYYTGVEEWESASPQYYRFMLSNCERTLGYMRHEIVQRFPMNEHWRLDDKERKLIFSPQTDAGDPVKTLEERNNVMAEYLQGVREQKIFQVLKGWRSELYPIYGPNKEVLLSMERSATPLFGVVTYGVHMTGYVKTDHGLKIWAPRRALTKPTYPGMMDNTVAGGLSIGETPFSCLIRECEEEASLPEEIVRPAHACGTLTYFHVRGESAGGEVGLCQPECQYIYDLELSADVIPKPGDDEAIDFQLLSVADVQEAMAAGRFKPNCAHLLLEFFVRHGILTPENEPHYVEIVSRLHRRLEFPTP